MYWSLKSIPELADLPRSQRGVLWRQCYFQALKERPKKFLLLFAGIGLGAGVGNIVGGILGGYNIVGGGVGAAIAGMFVSQLLVEYVRPYLKKVRPDQISAV